MSKWLLPVLSVALLVACGCNDPVQVFPPQGPPPTTVRSEDMPQIQPQLAQQLEQARGAAPTKAAGSDGLVAELQQGVRIRRLANGLVLITKENHVAPVVSVFAVVRAGGMLEQEYLGAGISHLTEHLVAGGSTTNRTEDEIQKTLDDIGAVSNAYTAKDRTAYFINTTPQFVGTAIDLIADYLQHAKIDQAEFDREFGVVQREILTGEGEPGRQAAYLMDDALYPNTPQGVRVIGYYANIQQLTRDDVWKYYKQRYEPSNAVVCAAGDFDGAAVLDLLEKAFGQWTAPHAPPVVLPEPTPPVSDIVVVKEMDTRLAQVQIAYHSCRLSDPDLYPLDVLADVLGQGDSSRLAADLKTDRNLVYGISCWNYTPEWPGGEFAVGFTCDPDKVDEARAAVAAHLEQVCREPPSADEVEKVKRIKVAEQLLGLRTAAAQARSLCTDQMSIEDPYFSARYVENIQRVTPEEVFRAARKYLQGKHSITAIVRPKSGAEEAPAAAAAAPPKTTRIVFPDNGLTLLVLQTPGQPAVSMIAAMKAGQSIETADTAGITSITARMLERGTATRSEQQIASFFDGIGGSISTGSGWNSLFVQSLVLKRDFDAAFDVFADVVLNPAFDADKLVSTRKRQLAALATTLSDPFGQCALYFDEQFFVGSPYRFPQVGRPESINALTREDLRDFYQRIRVGRNMVVTIAGDVDPGEVERMIRERFAAKLSAGEPVEAPADVPQRKVESMEIYVKQTDKPAATVIVGYPGTDLYDLKDRFAMDVFATIAAGYYMPRGWLHDTLRGQSLVYAVHFSGREGLLPGYYRATALCQSDKVTRVARLIEDLLASGRDYAYTDDDLAQARTTILTARKMQRQTPEQIAQGMTFDELYGLGYDFEEKMAERIQAVTADDVRRVARKFINDPVICITTPKPDEVDTEELRKAYDAARLEAMRAETPEQVHRPREHMPPQ